MNFFEDGFNFRSRFHISEFTLEKANAMELQAISEVDEYLRLFRDSIMNPSAQTSRVWWLNSRIPVARVSGQCRSLNLSNGHLCAAKAEKRWCEYHMVQHDILCVEYHARQRTSINGVSSSTQSFIEYILRKEFDLIFGYAGVGQSDERHKIRYSCLLYDMFDLPFPPPHKLVLDPEFTRVARTWRNILDKRAGKFCKQNS